MSIFHTCHDSIDRSNWTSIFLFVPMEPMPKLAKWERQSWHAIILWKGTSETFVNLKMKAILSCEHHQVNSTALLWRCVQNGCHGQLILGHVLKTGKTAAPDLCVHMLEVTIFNDLYCQAVNSLRPSDAYICHQPRPSLVQIMACCLVGDKPLSELMLELLIQP